RMFAAPVGTRIGPVDGLFIIEAVVASRNELWMKIGNFALIVGKYCIVRTVRFEVCDLEEGWQIPGLGPAEALLDCLNRLVHHRERDPAVAVRTHDRPVMRSPSPECLRCQRAAGAPVPDSHRPNRERPALRAVAVTRRSAAFALDLFGELVDAVDAAR